LEETDVALKKIIHSFELEELAIGDTADTKFEGNKSYTTAFGENQNIQHDDWFTISQCSFFIQR
jgi:hypothetical protein